jgi:hypothetical protein
MKTLYYLLGCVAVMISLLGFTMFILATQARESAALWICFVIYTTIELYKIAEGESDV